MCEEAVIGEMWLVEHGYSPRVAKIKITRKTDVNVWVGKLHTPCFYFGRKIEYMPMFWDGIDRKSNLNLYTLGEKRNIFLQ